MRISMTKYAIHSRRDVNKRITKVDLNGVVKQKIEHSCFITCTNNLLIIYSDGKVTVYDYLLNA